MEGKVRDFIPVSEPAFLGNEKRYLDKCIETGWISSAGSFIPKFEEKFAEFCSVKKATTVFNGTIALHLALHCAGVRPGDEVIVPNMTFASTANAVLHCGAKPVFADILGDTWTLNPKSVKEKISNKTKAVIPVHIYGTPAEMNEINEIAENHSIFVLEDAAEAHGAKYRGEKVGSLGNAAIFSFYGNKIMTTGEGGMIVSNDLEFIEKANLYKNHGMSKEKKYWHPVIGYNFRMTNMQAAVGLAQLEKIDELISKRLKIVKKYKKALSGIKGISFQAEKEHLFSTWWMFSILLNKNYSLSRDKLREKLKKAGIDTRPLFYPFSKMPPYEKQEGLRVSEEIAARGINLPTSLHLSSEEIKYIAQKIESFS